MHNYKYPGVPSKMAHEKSAIAEECHLQTRAAAYLAIDA